MTLFCSLKTNLDMFYQILKCVVLVSFSSCLLEDELTGILKKLSLEKYQPIFEEQEVRVFLSNVSLKS